MLTNPKPGDRVLFGIKPSELVKLIKPSFFDDNEPYVCHYDSCPAFGKQEWEIKSADGTIKKYACIGAMELINENKI